MPNPAEVATVDVRGQRFNDWESVWVQNRWTEAYPLFRFTAAERDPLPNLWSKQQWVPQDECAIYLGGVLAVAGIIISRQVAYDANNHAVQLEGVGITWYATRAGILDKKSNYDGMTFEQVARKVLAPFGIAPLAIGTLNATPFKQLQNQPGESVWDFLERIARVRGIVLGSDHEGHFLMIDYHSKPVVDTLIEGQNILKMQCLVSIKDKFSLYVVRGQTGGSNDKSGPDASEQEASAPGTLGPYSPLLTPAEQPVWNTSELADRARAEAIWHEGWQIDANVTVQGWFNSRGDLWRPGDNVYVVSPMAMLNNVLKINTATYTQDRNSGTLTVLNLVPPWLLKDRGNFPVPPPGSTPVPAAPDPTDAKGNSQPAQTPPAADAKPPPPATLE